jgi:DNA gyrase subunit A
VKTMKIERPDLSGVDSVVRAYIETLEAELARLQSGEDEPIPSGTPAEPSEPPTTLNVITVSRSGLAKRTPRHLYMRQRRGGMGIFDLESPADDPPTFLTIADEDQDLLLITNRARAFRLPAGQLPEAPIRSRGQSLPALLRLDSQETLAAVLPHQTNGYFILVTEDGQVRRLRHHIFGENMEPGKLLYDVKAIGRPAATCWTTGDGDLFIATRQGRAIRFDESLVPPKGALGLRLSAGDQIVGVTGVRPDSGVFLLTADGKGTIRLMSGFSPNKAPGAGGKTALNTDQLAAIAHVSDPDDVFIISRLSKIIRFEADEVPPKEGVVQGVTCMNLRADEAVAIAIGRPASNFLD